MCEKEEFCSFILLLVSEPSPFSLRILKKSITFQDGTNTAFAHWSAIFKYLILSQITVLLGKLNVSVRDSFTHFCGCPYSIQSSPQEQPAQQSVHDEAGFLSHAKAFLLRLVCRLRPPLPPACALSNQKFHRGAKNIQWISEIGLSKILPSGIT